MMKKIKTVIAAAAFVAALSGNIWAQPPAGSPVAKHGRLTTKVIDGKGYIVNKDGVPVALRGMSFFWNQWDVGSVYYTKDVTDSLASNWKVDILRVAINPGSTGSNNWKTVADAAIARGVYVVIDFHAHNKNLRDDAKNFFKGLDAKYKNNDAVIYEIFNEPCPTNKDYTNGGGGGCGGDNWVSDIRPYAQFVVDTIRGNGANNIIVIGTGDYSKRVDHAAESPVTGSNLAYAVHFYTAEPGTEHQEDLRAWCRTANNKGLALLVTEWGLSEADGGQKNASKIDTEEAERWFEFLDQRSIGWMNWSICNKPEAASAVKSSAGADGKWGAGDLTPSGTFIRTKLREYAEKVHTVTVTVVGQGEVKKSQETHPHGSSVTLTATAASGWTFIGWGGANGDEIFGNPGTISCIYGNKSITATFEQGGMIKNGTFNSNVDPWFGDGEAVIKYEAVSGNGALRADVAGGSSSTRVRQNGLNLVHGKRYELSFRARTVTGSAKITPRLTNAANSANYFDTAAVELTAAWQTYKKEFDMCAASDASARVIFFCGGNSAAFSWYLDDVVLSEIGNAISTTDCNSSALPFRAAGVRTSWSLVGVSGGLVLRGPVEPGSTVLLYDTRGKFVRSAAASSGVVFGAGLPAGNYFMVVKNRAGKEVFKSRALLVQ